MANYAGTFEDDTYVGTAASDTITGDAGDDTLSDGPPSASADQISGGNGDDTIGVTGGADTVDGGSGVDRLIIRYGTFSADLLLSVDEVTGNSLVSTNGLSFTSIETFDAHFGSGNDNITLGNGDDRLSGGDGDDTLTCGGGSDVAFGGDGEDYIQGISGNDTLYGEDNGDQLRGDGGNDDLNGDAGNDKLYGGSGNDQMNGGAGADQLRGDGGIDSVLYTTSSAGVIVDLAANTGDGGDAEGDTYDSIEALYGSAFDDTFTGSGQGERLSGEAGNDVLRGGAGADQLHGGSGIDTASYFTGSAGVLVNLAGDSGTGSGGDAEGDSLDSIENLSGSQGSDSLFGDGGANVLQGWNGNDALIGRGGKDTLTGGIGGDHFDYVAVGDSVVGADADRITDFSHAQADKIDLAAIDANTGVAGNQAFSFIGTGLYTGVAGQLRHAQSGGVTTVAGDINGDGASDFHIQLTGAIALVAGDFVL